MKATSMSSAMLKIWEGRRPIKTARQLLRAKWFAVAVTFLVALWICWAWCAIGRRQLRFHNCDSEGATAPVYKIDGLATVWEQNHPVGKATTPSGASSEIRGQRRTGLAILDLLDPFGPNKLHTTLDIPLAEGATSDRAVPSNNSTSEIASRFEKLHIFVFAVHVFKQEPHDANGTPVWTLRVKGVVRDKADKLMFTYIVGTSSEKARDLRVTCRGEMDDSPLEDFQRWTSTRESAHQFSGRRQLRATGGEGFRTSASVDGDRATVETWEGPAKVDQRFWRLSLGMKKPVAFQSDFLCELPPGVGEQLSVRKTKLTLMFEYMGGASTILPVETERGKTSENENEVPINGGENHSRSRSIELSLGPVIRDGPYKLAGCMGPLFGRQSRRQWVDWLEYHVHVAGFERFFLYSVDDTAHLIEVLRDYIEEGLVDIRKWETFGTEEKFVGSHKYYDELTIRSHCIYRNKGVATWLAFHDVDEYLFIRNVTQSGNVTAFLDELPESLGEVMVMRYRFPMEHPRPGAQLLIEKYLNRSSRFDEKLGKPLVRTAMALEVSSHELDAFEDGSQNKTAENSVTLEASEGILNHYRRVPESRGDPTELLDRYAAYINQAPFNVLDEGENNIALFAPRIRESIDARMRLTERSEIVT